jgi:hypothetical protein
VFAKWIQQIQSTMPAPLFERMPFNQSSYRRTSFFHNKHTIILADQLKYKLRHATNLINLDVE